MNIDKILFDDSRSKNDFSSFINAKTTRCVLITLIGVVIGFAVNAISNNSFLPIELSLAEDALNSPFINFQGIFRLVFEIVSDSAFDLIFLYLAISAAFSYVTKTIINCSLLIKGFASARTVGAILCFRSELFSSADSNSFIIIAITVTALVLCYLILIRFSIDILKFNSNRNLDAQLKELSFISSDKTISLLYRGLHAAGSVILINCIKSLLLCAVLT